MSIKVDEATLYKLVEAVYKLPPPRNSALIGGAVGFSVGLNFGLDSTIQMRKELGLGGELFGYFILTPLCSIAGAGIGCGLACGVENGIAKIASAIIRLRH